MSRALALFIALCAFGATPCLAATTPLTFDQTTFSDDCKLAGGAYRVLPGGKVACGSADCDGLAGQCIVVCDGDQCVAQTPHALKNDLSLHAILRDGKRLRPAPAMPTDFWGDPAEPHFDMH